MYSLIVSSSSDQWDITPAEFPLDRYLEHSAPELVARFRLSHEVARELLEMPTVFTYEKGSGPVARVGWIKDLTWSASTMRFGFEFDPRVPPIDLNTFYAASDHLGITRFEPNRNHWAVKDVDLANALTVAGLITQEQSALLSLPRWLLTTPAPTLPSSKPPAQVIGNRGNLGLSKQQLASFPVTGPPGVGVIPKALSGASLANSVGAALNAAESPIDASIPQRVFVVHGRNNELKADVLLFLERIGVEPIVLHEQVNAGRTIYEKFGDVASGVSFAVVLMTPDDVGGLSAETLQPRARQNVLLELGYFIGKLGKERVCALMLGDMEIPSDYVGVAYLPVNSNWRAALARELNAAGIRIKHEKVTQYA